jgi:hypothetical protein
MSLVKQLNYYQDSNGFYQRIPWDSWILDGVFVGISPSPFGETVNISFDSSGNVILLHDFFDEGQGDDISGLTLQTSEDAFLDIYDDVCYMYESDCCQTYETDYHESTRNS